MALKPTREKMDEAEEGFLEPGEEVVTVGWGSRKGVKYFYIALTNRRIIIIRLSTFYKVKGEESIPLSEVEACTIHEGFKYAPPDMQLIASMAETPFYIKTKGGKKYEFMFPVIMGLQNKEVPVTIMETLKVGA